MPKILAKDLKVGDKIDGGGTVSELQSYVKVYYDNRGTWITHENTLVEVIPPTTKVTIELTEEEVKEIGNYQVHGTVLSKLLRAVTKCN